MKARVRRGELSGKVWEIPAIVRCDGGVTGVVRKIEGARGGSEFLCL